MAAGDAVFFVCDKKDVAAKLAGEIRKKVAKDLDLIDPNVFKFARIVDFPMFQYDIVCNGVELSSGAIRNHVPEIMYNAFKVAGYGPEVVERKFGSMINAFKLGAPRYGGRVRPPSLHIPFPCADPPMGCTHSENVF